MDLSARSSIKATTNCVNLIFKFELSKTSLTLQRDLASGQMSLIAVNGRPDLTNKGLSRSIRVIRIHGVSTSGTKRIRCFKELRFAISDVGNKRSGQIGVRPSDVQLAGLLVGSGLGELVTNTGKHVGVGLEGSDGRI